VFDQLTSYISGSDWTYAAVLALCAFDAIFPVLPSETSVILGGVLSASGHLQIGLIVLAAATGAVLGDNLAYGIGRFGGSRLADRFRRGAGHDRVDWAERQVQQRGPYLILVGRFIPGGRTLITLTCGSLVMPWRRFILWDVVAAVVWATYAAGLGYAGGATFADHPWLGFLVAFVVALTVTGVVEGVRALRRRRAAV
jgi:membrane protein DedA with SNARE-associated domain